LNAETHQAAGISPGTSWHPKIHVGTIGKSGKLSLSLSLSLSLKSSRIGFECFLAEEEIQTEVKTLTSMEGVW